MLTADADENGSGPVSSCSAGDGEESRGVDRQVAAVVTVIMTGIWRGASVVCYCRSFVHTLHFCSQQLRTGVLKLNSHAVNLK